jgi:hypothetical protein
MIAKSTERADQFPHNITFKTENFVEGTHTELYDTISWYSMDV